MKTDTVIVGAGVIGLAISYSLSMQGYRVILLEKERRFGTGVSSRSSEQIHSGAYYEKDSLKAVLCLKGKELLYEFCEKHDIGHKRLGKLFLAVDEKEINRLEITKSLAEANGINDLEELDARQLKKIEPNLHGQAALFSPSSGIIDSHGFMHKLEYLITSNESSIVYNTEVHDITCEDEHYFLSFKDMDYSAKSKIVINSAGLWCDSVSRMVGITNYKLHLCKGEYYTTSMYRNKLNSLIYPLPTEISLGTHIVLHLDGSIGFGPNAYYVDKIDYRMDNSKPCQVGQESGLVGIVVVVGILLLLVEKEILQIRDFLF